MYLINSIGPVGYGIVFNYTRHGGVRFIAFKIGAAISQLGGHLKAKGAHSQLRLSVVSIIV